jgi:CBS domain containing-hemolysin-like protein
MTSAWSGIGWFALLLLGNGFFVGAEFALMSARRAQIEPRAEAGSGPARITIKAMENVSLMLAATQLGVTICSLLILLIVEPSMHEILHPLLQGFSEEAAGGIAFGITLALVSFLHVVIGEMVPKNISFSIPERAALILIPVLYGFAQIVRPITWFLNAAANLILKIFRISYRDDTNSAFTLDQVEDIVAHSTREGVLLDASGTLSNTFEFTEKKVRDIAVNPADVISFDARVTPREIEQAVAKYGYSRYPLRDDNDEIYGYIHLKDVIDLRLDEVDQPLPAKRIRNLISLPATMELEDALASMKRVGAHMAKSFDRGGKVTGVLFLEDILEELVGEVQDATQRD